jgi:hypothetical protein
VAAALIERVAPKKRVSVVREDRNALPSSSHQR